MKSKRIAAVVAGVLVSGALFGVASANEHEPTNVYGGGEDDVVLVEYDEDNGTLTLAIRGEDGEFPECVETNGEDAPDAEAADELPEGCFVVSVDGDPEDLNHGKFVSAVAKALHPSLLPDGVKKGHIMRVVAKSKLGKDGDVTDGDAGDGDGDDTDKAAEKAERKAEREAAKAERKAEREAAKAERKAAKAERKANKSGGPPDHAKAKGKRANG